MLKSSLQSACRLRLFCALAFIGGATFAHANLDPSDGSSLSFFERMGAVAPAQIDAAKSARDSEDEKAAAEAADDPADQLGLEVDGVHAEQRAVDLVRATLPDAFLHALQACQLGLDN